ncbi:Molybdenum cofactor biosynthesis protein MoaA [Minicystis rosea]|nr:Molybdenum cofactor biosynthesis protein MoaA [Minicystis rosea]
MVRLPKVEIYVTDVCNNRCSYCTTGWENTENARSALKHVPRERIRELLAEHYEKGARRVVLQGGEPTVRRDLGEILADARAVGYEATTVFTNARAASSPIAARWLASMNVTWFQVSIQGGTAEAHDASVVAARAFKQTIEGTRRLLALGQRVKVNGVLTVHLLDTLREFAALMIELGPEEVGLDVVRPSPAFAPDRADYGELLPPLSRYSEALRDALLAMNEAGIIARVVSCPPCLVPGAERFVSEEQATTVTQIPTGAFMDKLAQRRSLQVKGPACAACVYEPTCPGLFAPYAERHGFGELRPVTERRPIDPPHPANRGHDGPAPERTSMRIQTVVVTRRCNQGCGFCDRVQHDAADPSAQTVGDSIRAAIASGARALILSGGEPLLRPDLGAIVRRARADGAVEITLETNGTRIDSKATAEALKAAGITAVQISLVTSNVERHRALVVVPRGAETRPQHVFRGIRACLDAGLPVTMRIPIARGLPPAAARIAGLHEAFPALDRFVLAPIGSGTATFREGQALSPEELGEELTQAYKMGERAKVNVALAADCLLPPCVSEVQGGARRLFAALLRDNDGAPNQACEACARCALAPRCTAEKRHIEAAGGEHLVKPIADAGTYFRPGKSAGSRLRVLGAAEVETFFHVNYEYGTEVDEPTSRLGIVYRCNQVCTFCELADMDTDLAPEKVRAAIDQSRARGSKRLIVTGGEPTLSPHLVDYVRHAKDRGIERIELQTNAVLLDKPGFAEALREAGLTSAQVSLHGPDSAVSDRLTAAPGTHQRTLKGVTNLLRVGVRVLLNHLIFKDNCHLLGAFVDMVEERWGQYRSQIVIQFHSPRNEFQDRREGLRHIARYSDYVDELRRAIDKARSLGFDVHDLQDPTGIPSLCVLGADERYLGPILAQTERPRLHAWESEWMTRVDACHACDARTACMGVPRHYLALHGDAEFAAIRLRGREGAPAPVLEAKG